MPVFRNNQTCLCAEQSNVSISEFPAQSARHIPSPLLRTAIGIGTGHGLGMGLSTTHRIMGQWQWVTPAGQEASA